jgi:hypothetical protein
LFQQIQDDRAFAVSDGQPYGDLMIANNAHTIFLNTGLFPDDCHEWQVRQSAQRTWIIFKFHFAAAHREFRLTNITAQQSGFHSDNMII